MARQRKRQYENMTDYGSENYGSPGWARRGDSFAIWYVPPAPSSAAFVNGSITGEPAAYSSANAQYNDPTVHHYAPPEASMMQHNPNSFARAGEPPRQPMPREMLSFQGKTTDRIRYFDAPTSINATGKFDENQGRQFLQPYHSEANPSAGNVLSLGQGSYDQNSSWATMLQQHSPMSFSDHPAQSIGPLHGDSTKSWGSFDGSAPDAVPFGTTNQYLEQPAKLRASSWSFPGETTGFKSFPDPTDQRRVFQGSTVDCDPSMNSHSHQHGLASQSSISEERCHQGLHQPMLTPQEATRSQKKFSTVPGLAIPMPFYPYDKPIASKEHLDHPNGIANEEGVQALKKPKRKRKDGNTKTRTLTAYGKDHANRVRKAGACYACRRSHVTV
ncbi:hypothetical protein OEA41_002660 [Lepraria neglecta]|uniref:Uncharacterized protein n=1 Tax=Lepraria neglecta TaxID=209136 RepID=A0AAD9Z2V9_9LECA|nr:hypothetical protein OEA41_002660 [Lepraria neglecta]